MPRCSRGGVSFPCRQARLSACGPSRETRPSNPRTSVTCVSPESPSRVGLGHASHGATGATQKASAENRYRSCRVSCPRVSRASSSAGSVMGCERLAHLGEASAEARGVFYRNALAPSHEVPAHLVDCPTSHERTGRCEWCRSRRSGATGSTWRPRPGAGSRCATPPAFSTRDDDRRDRGDARAVRGRGVPRGRRGP